MTLPITPYQTEILDTLEFTPHQTYVELKEGDYRINEADVENLLTYGLIASRQQSSGVTYDITNAGRDVLRATTTLAPYPAASVRRGRQYLNWGGARPGAGRKPIAETPVRLTVTLTPAQADKARVAGEGNMAAGVRMLIDTAP